MPYIIAFQSKYRQIREMEQNGIRCIQSCVTRSSARFFARSSARSFARSSARFFARSAARSTSAPFAHAHSFARHWLLHWCDFQRSLAYKVTGKRIYDQKLSLCRSVIVSLYVSLYLVSTQSAIVSTILSEKDHWRESQRWRRPGRPLDKELNRRRRTSLNLIGISISVRTCWHSN